MVSEETYRRVKMLLVPALEEVAKMDDVDSVMIVMHTDSGYISFGSMEKPREWFHFLVQFIDSMLFNKGKRKENIVVGETPSAEEKN